LNKFAQPQSEMSDGVRFWWGLWAISVGDNCLCVVYWDKVTLIIRVVMDSKGGVTDWVTCRLVRGWDVIRWDCVY
jgi:hypothetical protein